MRETLEQQRHRVQEEITAYDLRVRQTVLEVDTNELRQREADRRAWGDRLAQFEVDLRSEPQRVRNFYSVATSRVEPIGLAYLWPESN